MSTTKTASPSAQAANTSLGALIRAPFVRLIAASIGCVLLATSAGLALEVVELTAGEVHAPGVAELRAVPTTIPLSLRMASVERSLATH